MELGGEQKKETFFPLPLPLLSFFFFLLSFQFKRINWSGNALHAGFIYKSAWARRLLV